MISMISPSKLHHSISYLKSSHIGRGVLVKLSYPCKWNSGAFNSLDPTLYDYSMGSRLCFLLLRLFQFFWLAISVIGEQTLFYFLHESLMVGLETSEIVSSFAHLVNVYVIAREALSVY